MNTWQKIVLGSKFLFGGFESATDYILSILNKWLSSPDIALKSAAYRQKVASVHSALVKYGDYCPLRWHTAYLRLCDAVWTVLSALSDDRITPDELNSVVDSFKAVYSAWNED